MNELQEFHFESLPTSGRGIWQLSLGVEETQDMVEEVFLTCHNTVSLQSIRDEIAKYCRDGVLRIPVLAARGAEEGRVLVATAGIHGDEYEGMEAIFRVFDSLDPARMHGTFVAVPIATFPAFWMGTRADPWDGRNMARTFPGSSQGSISERLAAMLLDRVMRHASLYIDLHSGGRNYHMLTLCGYVTEGDQASIATPAAESFGAPVIWAHPSVSPGRTLTSTLEAGIPSLYTEGYGGGQARPQDVDCYTQGLANLFSFLEIAELPQVGLPEPYQPLRLHGSGDVDVAMKASQGGLFFTSLELGAKIRKGDLLGVLRSVEGRMLEEVRSPEEGVLVMIRCTPRVFSGELIVVVSSED